MKEFICVLGIIFCPIFTLGCVLVYYKHPILGIIAIIASFISGGSDD